MGKEPLQSIAFVYHGHPGAVSRETIKVDCGPREMLVEILMCARCGTDKTIYRYGHPNVDPYAPVVLGHELVGRIVYVGEEVPLLEEGIGYREGRKLPSEYLDFRIGERVTVQSRIARHDPNGLMLIPRPIANLSFQIDGGYSQYMCIPEKMIRSESVLRVPDGVTNEEACLVEPAACALESIFSTPHPVGVDAEGRHLFRAGIRKRGHVCIIGSGTVSLIYAMLARLEGASSVTIIVRSERKKLMTARLLGGDVNVYIMPVLPEEDSPETIRGEDLVVNDLTKMTDGYLFDDVIAACASTSAQRLMLKLYTREGGAVGACFGGTHSLVSGADIDVNHYRAAKTVGSSGCSTDCMKTILGWLVEGRLGFRGLTSERRFSLQDDPREFFTTEVEGLKPVLYVR